MSDSDKKELMPIDTSTKNLVQAIMIEEDATKLKDLTHLFKVNMAKKNIIRLIKYYDMVDLVNEQTMKRLEHRPDEISNKDLLSFMTTFLQTIEKTTQTLDTLDDTTTALVINQQSNEVNINVGVDKLDRKSREKVVDTIKSFMALVSSDSIQEDNIIDVNIEDDVDIEEEITEEGEIENE